MEKGYGKRPVWQWVVIYLIVGAIVYGLIYYFWMGKSGGYNYGSASNSSNSAPYSQ